MPSDIFLFIPGSSRCSVSTLRHRPAAVHWLRDGVGLEGAAESRWRPHPWLLPGPEGGRTGDMERGQRQVSQRAAVQGERGGPTSHNPHPHAHTRQCGLVLVMNFR